MKPFTKSILLTGLLIPLLFSGFSSKPDEGVIPPAVQGNLHLFAFIGQSQLVGVAPVPSVHPHSDTVFIFRNNYLWGFGNEPFDLNTNQVDPVSYDSYARMTPAIPFGVAIEGLGLEGGIGLIPCAKDGSTMAQWHHGRDSSSLYGSCWKRMMIAQMMGNLDGIIIMQGESNAHSIAEANAWPALFTELVENLRRDLRNPNLPIVFAQLGTNGSPASYPGWETLKQLQSEIDIPNVSMVQTDDLSRYDVVHLSAASDIILGSRLADAMYPMIP